MQHLKGISPLVDSCAGMIAQQAYKAHRLLPQEHKRWIDPEDLLQNALLEAVAAEKRYDPSKPAKYSTYLMTGLQYALSKEVSATRVLSRASRGMVELDAPVSVSEGETRTREVKSDAVGVDVSHEVRRRAVYGLCALCQRVSAECRLVIVKTLLFGRRLESWELVLVMDEAMPVAAQLQLRWADLAVLREDEICRKMALIQLVRNAIIGLTETDARLLECVRCSGQFPLSAIREGRYVVSTMTCLACYCELKDLPFNESCFGKPSDTGGYDPKDVNCQIHCRDRLICRSVAEGENIVADTETKEALKDVDFEEEETPKKKKTTPKAEKANKAETKSKASDEEEDPDNGPSPKEVGPRWPWKRNSHMRNAFAWIYQNKPTEEEFVKAFKKVGANTAGLLRLIRKGRSGKGFITHTWKVDEQGGRLKIHDVKYLGPDGRAASEFKSERKTKAKAKAASSKPAKTEKAKKTKKAAA